MEVPKMSDQSAFQVSDLAGSGDYAILADLTVGKRRVFEFGSFIGGSAVAMLPSIIEAGGHLWCIDHFQGNPEDPATQYPEGVILAGFLHRTQAYRGYVTLIMGDTSEARHFPQGFADLVFIDAGHGYDQVKRDIEIALHLLGGQGIICGHDYIKHLEDCDPALVETHAMSPTGGHGGIGYGVIKAVNELLGRPNHRPDTAIWWVDLEAREPGGTPGGGFVGQHGIEVKS